MDGNGHQNNGKMGGYWEEESGQQYDDFGNPVPNNTTYNGVNGQHLGHQPFLPSHGTTAPGTNNTYHGSWPPQHPNSNPFLSSSIYQDPLTTMLRAEVHNNNNLSVNPNHTIALTNSWPPMHGPFAPQPDASQYHLQHTHQASINVPTAQGTFDGQPPANHSNVPNNTYSVNNTALPAQQTAAAPPSSSSEPSDSDEEPEYDYFDPDTDRPLRDFLPHERVLLQQFYLMKNQSSPTPTYHQAMLWWLNLPMAIQDEWIRFVLGRQTRTEAQDRNEAVREHVDWLRGLKEREAAKFRSIQRGNEFGKPGRPPGKKNKPKTDTPTKGGRVSKKATPRKGTNTKKGKKPAKQQPLDNDEEEEGN